MNDCVGEIFTTNMVLRGSSSTLGTRLSQKRNWERKKEKEIPFSGESGTQGTAAGDKCGEEKSRNLPIHSLGTRLHLGEDFLLLCNLLLRKGYSTQYFPVPVSLVMIIYTDSFSMTRKFVLNKWMRFCLESLWCFVIRPRPLNQRNNPYCVLSLMHVPSIYRNQCISRWLKGSKLIPK